MQLEISVRPYEPADAEATATLLLRAIRQTAARDYTPEEIEAWPQVEDPAAWATVRMSRPTWLAEIDGRPAGFADLDEKGCTQHFQQKCEAVLRPEMRDINLPEQRRRSRTCSSSDVR